MDEILYYQRTLKTKGGHARGRTFYTLGFMCIRWALLCVSNEVAYPT